MPPSRRHPRPLVPPASCRGHNRTIEPTPVSPAAFAAALAQGRGLPALALQSGNPAPYGEALLAGCVENLQFDRQCEENRADYFMRLLDLAGLRDEARDRILQAVPGTEDGWDRDWMVDLLEALATEGDVIAYDVLRDLAAGGNERAQNGLACTGEAGLGWVAEHVLPTLPDDERYRISFWLPDEEADDATPLQKRLRAEYLAWDAARTVERKPLSSKGDDAATFLKSLDRPKGPLGNPVAFARLATPRQWRAAARRFLRETRPRTLRRLARAYQDRPFPLPFRRLLRHVHHPQRGDATLRVLGTLDHPAVRRFVLGLLCRRPLPWNAIEGLGASLRKGDEPLVLTALESTAEHANTDRHGPVLDAIALMFGHPALSWQPHAEWIFVHSPCSFCRASAVRWMAEHGALTGALLAEMPYDAEPDVRAAATAGSVAA